MEDKRETGKKGYIERERREGKQNRNKCMKKKGEDGKMKTQLKGEKEK